jgi:hypothetical protein
MAMDLSVLDEGAEATTEERQEEVAEDVQEVDANEPYEGQAIDDREDGDGDDVQSESEEEGGEAAETLTALERWRQERAKSKQQKEPQQNLDDPEIKSALEFAKFAKTDQFTRNIAAWRKQGYSEDQIALYLAQQYAANAQPNEQNTDNYGANNNTTDIDAASIEARVNELLDSKLGEYTQQQQKQQQLQLQQSQINNNNEVVFSTALSSAGLKESDITDEDATALRDAVDMLYQNIDPRQYAFTQQQADMIVRTAFEDKLKNNKAKRSTNMAQNAQNAPRVLGAQPGEASQAPDKSRGKDPYAPLKARQGITKGERVKNYFKLFS